MCSRSSGWSRPLPTWSSTSWPTSSRHHLIDGSGMLQGANEAAPHRLALGMTFGMGMKMLVSYSTVNKVVEFEENRRIAWKTGPERTDGQGRWPVGSWRYELTPVEGGTLVRESWDITDRSSACAVEARATSGRARPAGTWSGPSNA